MADLRPYAHNLHPEPGHDAGLDQWVPYLLARAIGFGPYGDTWTTPGVPDRLLMERVNRSILASWLALLADALHQGLGGEDAWKWALEQLDEDGGWVLNRAQHHDIDVDGIRPYPLTLTKPEAKPRRIHDPDRHVPYDDDGLLYCGWLGGDGIHDGCGHAWPCPTVTARGES